LAARWLFAGYKAVPALYNRGMKRLRVLLVLPIGLAALLSGCETTHTAGRGNQEEKRLAALRQEQEEAQAHDESTRNLWNAQRDVMLRDGNPARNYY
jgi:predicted small secreted protein